MERCPTCGAEIVHRFPHCLKCGVDLVAARAAAAEARGLGPGDPRRFAYLTLSTLSNCRHCGSGLPVQGPARSIRCGACQGVNELGAERWGSFLTAAVRGIREVFGAMRFEYPGQHSCPGCGAAIDLRTIPMLAESSTPCPRCGRGIVAYPPPAWLKNELPTLLLIIGGEREPADVPAGAAGAQPIAVQGAAAPVVLACPNCKGSLKVDGETARTMTCQFCNANVYLPDELWRILHPVKRVEAWSFVYDQALRSREEIEQLGRKAEEQAREQAQRARAEEGRSARAAAESSQKAESARVSSRRIQIALAVVLAIVLVVVAAVIYLGR